MEGINLNSTLIPKIETAATVSAVSSSVTLVANSAFVLYGSSAIAPSWSAQLLQIPLVAGIPMIATATLAVSICALIFVQGYYKVQNDIKSDFTAEKLSNYQNTYITNPTALKALCVLIPTISSSLLYTPFSTYLLTLNPIVLTISAAGLTASALCTAYEVGKYTAFLSRKDSSVPIPTPVEDQSIEELRKTLKITKDDQHNLTIEHEKRLAIIFNLLGYEVGKKWILNTRMWANQLGPLVWKLITTATSIVFFNALPGLWKGNNKTPSEKKIDATRFSFIELMKESLKGSDIDTAPLNTIKKIVCTIGRLLHNMWLNILQKPIDEIEKATIRIVHTIPLLNTVFGIIDAHPIKVLEHILFPPPNVENDIRQFYTQKEKRVGMAIKPKVENRSIFSTLIAAFDFSSLFATPVESLLSRLAPNDLPDVWSILHSTDEKMEGAEIELLFSTRNQSELIYYLAFDLAEKLDVHPLKLIDLLNRDEKSPWKGLIQVLLDQRYLGEGDFERFKANEGCLFTKDTLSTHCYREGYLLDLEQYTYREGYELSEEDQKKFEEGKGYFIPHESFSLFGSTESYYHLTQDDLARFACKEGVSIQPNSQETYFIKEEDLIPFKNENGFFLKPEHFSQFITDQINEEDLPPVSTTAGYILTRENLRQFTLKQMHSIQPEYLEQFVTQKDFLRKRVELGKFEDGKADLPSLAKILNRHAKPSTNPIFKVLTKYKRLLFHSPRFNERDEHISSLAYRILSFGSEMLEETPIDSDFPLDESKLWISEQDMKIFEKKTGVQTSDDFKYVAIASLFSPFFITTPNKQEVQEKGNYFLKEIAKIARKHTIEGYPPLVSFKDIKYLGLLQFAPNKAKIKSFKTTLKLESIDPLQLKRAAIIQMLGEKDAQITNLAKKLRIPEEDLTYAAIAHLTKEDEIDLNTFRTIYDDDQDEEILEAAKNAAITLLIDDYESNLPLPLKYIPNYESVLAKGKAISQKKLTISPEITPLFALIDILIKVTNAVGLKEDQREFIPQAAIHFGLNYFSNPLQTILSDIETI